MENPHEAEQNVLLERIIGNVGKCDEAFRELNTCLREIVESSAQVRSAAELTTNYEANAAHYLNNLKMMREPQYSKTGEQ